MAGKGQPKTGGRQKGSVNKSTREMREMVYEAFDLAGGVEYLLAQSEKNPTSFMALVGKMIPQASEHKIEGDGIPTLILRQNYILGTTTEDEETD